ncbi:outer membrane beta-barrel protein [candidate division KSB3 bacterium]|uniref:Outer membrane beta-barrel protein n=1 Tax=candidate division KSB3 bacterium TaxID=2044937 RepID=A0A9D5JWT9_9BACT|nr:outer membrane beta-barrel protein [candidate division KSB3 bacterium]
MRGQNRKSYLMCLLLGSLMILWTGDGVVRAANISEFVNLTPYFEIEGGYDDNVFEIADDAELPENGVEREDSFLNAKAGVQADLMLERPYLRLEVGVDYDFIYTKYTENTDLDDVQNNLNFDLNFASNYERGLLKDRLRLHIQDVLSYVPIDEEEPLLPGNRVIRNDFDIGAFYKLISTRRMGFVLGYSYGRRDFVEDESIDVATVDVDDSSVLTQESQTHTGEAEFEYILNPKLTYLLSYTYTFADREENPGQLVSADFTRQNVLSGIQAKLTPRIQTNIQAGYALTSYSDVEDLEQDDQDSFVVEASVSANFARQPLMTVGYRRYYVENDFGDTLLTDNVFGRIGIKLMQDLLVNFSGDYILEDRDLFDDDTTQILFGVDTEYQLVKNLALLAGYQYKDKEFFAQNFLAEPDREETTHTFSGGLKYKVARYVLLKGMYFYTDRSSNLDDQEFSRNKFLASGQVMF